MMIWMTHIFQLAFQIYQSPQNCHFNSNHHVFGIRNIEYFVFGGNISSIWEPNLTLGTWNGGCILPFLVVKLLETGSEHVHKLSTPA